MMRPFAFYLLLYLIQQFPFIFCITNSVWQNFKGLNYIKSAYQKLSWIALLKGDDKAMKEYLSLCRIHGIATVDEDKEAESEAYSAEVQNPQLLKARLLFDGGYYSEAIKEITGKDISN